MKEFFRNMTRRISDGWHESDKKTKLKWTCIISAAIIGMFGNILDTKIKEESYQRQVNKAIADKVAKESKLNGNTTEG